MKYRNYIFDLYGTLIDIHTDEEMPQLWEFMSGYLEENFGTHISPGNLRREYLRICALEEEKLAGENGSMYPEIKIEWVWKKLIGKQTCTEDEMEWMCQAPLTKCEQIRWLYVANKKAMSLAHSPIRSQCKSY